MPAKTNSDLFNNHRKKFIIIIKLCFAKETRSNKIEDQLEVSRSIIDDSRLNDCGISQSNISPR